MEVNAGANDVIVSYVIRVKKDFVTASHNSVDAATGHDYVVFVWDGNSLLDQVVTKGKRAFI